MNSPTPQFDLLHFLRVIFTYRKHILILTGSAAVISIIVSLLLPNYYKSQAVFYPKGLSISDRSVIFSEKTGELEFEFYGTKHDANRILSLSNSSKIIDFTINYFDLAKHYGYDTSKTKYWRTKVKKEFNENFSIIKTDKDALEITLYDTDKDLCALMVNTMIEKIDEHNRTPYQENKIKIKESIKNELAEKDSALQLLTAEMVMMKKEFGIKTSGSGENTSFVGDNIEKVEAFKIKYFKQINIIEEINELKKFYYQYEVSAKNNETSLSVLEYAYPAEKKSKPIRWLIVVLSTVLTFVVAAFSALVYDVLKGINWSQITTK